MKGLAHRLGVGNIDRWVRSVFEYEAEPIETLHTVDNILGSIRDRGYFVGDCDDVSILIASLFKSLGCKVRFVAIRSKLNNPNFDHVFTDVMIDGQWRRFDPTVSVGTKHQYYDTLEVYV